MTWGVRGSKVPLAGIILLLVLRLHMAVGQDTVDDTIRGTNPTYPWEAPISTETTSVTTATTTAATTSKTTRVTAPPTTTRTTTTTAATTTSPAFTTAPTTSGATGRTTVSYTRTTSETTGVTTAPTTASTTATTTTVTPTAIITDENTALTDDGNIGGITGGNTVRITTGTTTTTTTVTPTSIITDENTALTDGGNTGGITGGNTATTEGSTGGSTATSTGEKTTVSGEGSASVKGLTDGQIILIVLGALGIGGVLTGLLFLLGTGPLSGLLGGFSAGSFAPAADPSGNAMAGRTSNALRYNNPYQAFDPQLQGQLQGQQEPPHRHILEHHHDQRACVRNQIQHQQDRHNSDRGGRSNHFYP